MIFRQMFDQSTWTYTYLLADCEGGKALIIDPVLEKMEKYQQLIAELDLQLAYAIDTHVHADHVTALAALREVYQCETVHGETSKAQGITKRVTDREMIHLDTLYLETIYTPGHTEDSYCFLLRTPFKDYLFSGDTLLIRGTGRTDFQNGCAEQQYQSLVNKILCLSDNTLVYPGHDYRGLTVSTIGEEKRFNPRLQVESSEEYVRLMGHLKLSEPRMMHVAVPANLQGGIPAKTNNAANA